MLFFRRKKYQKLNDKELLRLYCEGDERAIEELYTRYTRELILFAYKYLRNEAISEDIVSAQFVKLLEYDKIERHTKFTKIESVQAFFYTMVKNASLDYIKVHSNRADIQQQLHEFLEYSIESNAFQLLENQELHKQINMLPDKQKQYILLQLRGYKPSDIMKETGANSVQTIKNTLQQAKKNLKEKMSHEV